MGSLQAFFLYLTYLTEILNFTTALASQMLGAILVAVYGLYINQSGLPKLKNLTATKILFSKSAILGVNTVLAGFYQALEKNLVYQSLSSSEASTYLVHLKVVILFSFGLSALQISVVPHLIKTLSGQGRDKFLSYNFAIIIFVIFSFLVIFFIRYFFINIMHGI